MNYEDECKKYLDKFRDYFDNELNKKEFKYYEFSRTFEDKPDYVKSTFY